MDVAFRLTFEAERPGALRRLILALSPSVACVIRYRLQCFFASYGFGAVASTLKFINLILYAVDLDERARIGGGFVIAHPNAIQIKGDVTIGERFVAHHHVTIGSSPFCEVDREPGPLIIGDGAIFGMGSSAYGALVIGDNCRVGANTVVDRSFPAGAWLLGVPAKIVNAVASDA
jgi:serine O-acetyltransferase